MQEINNETKERTDPVRTTAAFALVADLGGHGLVVLSIGDVYPFITFSFIVV